MLAFLWKVRSEGNEIEMEISKLSTLIPELYVEKINLPFRVKAKNMEKMNLPFTIKATSSPKFGNSLYISVFFPKNYNGSESSFFSTTTTIQKILKILSVSSIHFRQLWWDFHPTGGQRESSQRFDLNLYGFISLINI